MSLSSITLQSLTTLLAHFIDTQLTLESLKSLIDFNQEELYKLFKLIDYNNNDKLSENELSQLFLQSGVQINNDEIQILFKQLDTNKDGWITLNEFLQVFQRNTTLVFYNFEQQQQQFDPMQLFLRICFEQIRSYQISSQYRIKLNTSYDFSVSQCFAAIDIQNKGYINIKNLGVFLKLKGKPRIERELLPFINRLGSKGNIDYKQFADLITGRNLDQDQNNMMYSQAIMMKINEQQLYQQQQQVSPIIRENIQQQKILNPPLIQSYINQQQFESPQQQQIQQSPQQKEQQIQQISEQPQELPLQTYPLSEADMKELIQVLAKLIDWERELQQLKNGLSQASDFNLLDAFRYFDINQNQEISKAELEEGLNKLGLFPTETELYLFYQSYDRDIDSLLQFGEFNQIFYTPDQGQVELMNSKAPNYVESPIKAVFFYYNMIFSLFFKLFTFETRMLLKATFQLLIETEVKFNHLRTRLSKRKHFNLKSAFNSLDVSQDGIISYEDLKEILSRFNVMTNQEDMVNLFRRFDRNLDGQIHYEEFIQEMAVKI